MSPNFFIFSNTLAFKIWIDMGNYKIRARRILEFHISIQILNAEVYMFQIPPLDRDLCNYFHDFIRKSVFLSSFEIHFDQILMRFFNRK